MKKKILVMDDEKMVGDIVRLMFDYIGFEVVHVYDGEAALQEYARAKENGSGFAAVIMDLTVPGAMGGREATEKLLVMDTEAKVFVSSGYSTDPIMVNFAEYGFAGAVAKPFDLAAIQNAFTPLL